MPHHKQPPTIGIFDSGAGGLSVLRAIRLIRPDINAYFVADQANLPYGSKPLEQVEGFAAGIVEHLLKREVSLIVVACNAASAASLHSLREKFPQLPFVGMEPAVKPAVHLSKSGIVGVLATPATFQGKLYASLLERFAENAKVMTSVCPGLVQQIEAGSLDGPKTRAILENAMHPMLEAGADSIVLGCTHYPFVIPLIESIAGAGVKIIDPSPAVARQVGKVLTEMQVGGDEGRAQGAIGTAQCQKAETDSDEGGWNKSPALGFTKFYTTGCAASFRSLIEMLLSCPADPCPLIWGAGELVQPTANSPLND